MELKNKMYHIVQKDVSGTACSYTVSLDPDHLIYKAHFPGQPITPGVCVVQIALELLEDALSDRLEISFVKNVKFVSVISPESDREITFHIDTNIADNHVSSKVIVDNSNKTFAKLSFTCIRK